MERPGFFRGKHYSAYPNEVRALKRQGQFEAAEDLLLALVEAAEAEARAEKWGVAPWYYEQLAIMYARRKETQKELAILERYESQHHAPGAMPPKLAERLARVRERINRGR
jgi:hypothetical protein